MAKHRKPKNGRVSSAKRADRNRQSPSLVLVGTTAAALSAVLVFGHATNTTAYSPQVELTAATIGIGGRGDPGGVNIPHKLQGNVLIPPDFNYIPVVYPAGFQIDNSVNTGVPVLADTITNNTQDAEGHDQFLLVVGYSEGTIVAEKVRRNLDPTDPGAPPLNPTNDPTQPGLMWVMIASPNVPNGGIFSRFPGLKIPFFVTSNGAAEPSPYNTTYVTDEYDPYADFPAYFNPFSLANSLVAVMYVHPDQYYDSVDYNPLDPAATTDPNVLVKTVTNSAGGHDTYVFVKAEHLPLFAPVRQIAGIVHLTPLTEPILGSVEPLVRLLVDMGYTDRENLNPEKPVQFSLITPPGKVLGAAAGVPGALGQGATNLVSGAEALPGSIPSPLAATDSPSINAKSLPQEEQEPSSADTSTTEPQATTLSDPGPNLGELTEDGNKATPTTPGKTTSPKKNPLTQLADSVKKFFSPKKKAEPSTPSPDSDSTANNSSSQAPSQNSTSNAAA
ncbi:MAG TPA: PE-PPE domain-containing protein [Mycobacterium sp.]|nr:PE-PPE domain-containing protein [Mycobacterium sp.]